MNNDFLIEYTKLINEWDWEKNNNIGISPETVTSGSSKKAWWKCKLGHEWNCRIVDRVKGSCCPVCSNKRILVGFNDLSTVAPELASEWHPILNGDEKPEQFSSGSRHKVWWRCKQGHEWQAIISERYKGTACPYCVGKKVLQGFNDLATTNPLLAKEWHPTKNGNFLPTMVREGSNHKVWWLGKCGHEWEATIGNRNNGSGCPICARKLVAEKNAVPQKGINDVLSVAPKLAAEWHPTKNGELLPSDVTINSHRKVWWLGKCGHEWEAHVSNRNRGDGCPICNQERGTSFPEKAMFYYLSKYFDDIVGSYHTEWLGYRELDIYIPSLKLAIEYDGKAWHQDIEKDLEKNKLCYENGVSLIRVRETTCPKLQSTSIDYQLEPVRADYSHLNKAIEWIINYIRDAFKPQISLNVDINVEDDTAKINELIERTQKDISLLSINPELAKEWHPSKNGRLTARMVTANSNRKVWWLGKCGHEWLAGIAWRSSGQGCPICSGRRVLKGFNDLATTAPEIAAEWHPTKNGKLLPTMVTAGSNRKVWWLGKCNHEWEAKIDGRRAGNGCPICGRVMAHQKRSIPTVGKSDLATVNPNLALEWHPAKNNELRPTMVYANSNRKVWWLGKCGHEWEATIASRNSTGNGCPFCSSRAVLPGFNDLQTVNPVLAEEWHPTMNGSENPGMFLPQSNHKAWWLGRCGHTWKTTIAGRTNGAGCPICSGNIVQSGFNDLATLAPELAKEWHPTKNGDLQASMVTIRSTRKVWWLGKCGHEWEATVGHRKQGRGCPICSGRKILVGFNDLQSKNPSLAKEWHPSKNEGLCPTDVTAGSGIKVWWKCENGHEWQAKINDRNRGALCPICKEVNRKSLG